MLENCWTSVYVGSWKELVLTSVKGRSSNNRIDELACKREGKQAKSKGSFIHLPIIWVALRRNHHIQGWSPHFI